MTSYNCLNLRPVYIQTNVFFLINLCDSARHFKAGGAWGWGEREGAGEGVSGGQRWKGGKG